MKRWRTVDGYYQDREDAVKARDALAKRFQGETLRIKCFALLGWAVQAGEPR
jgi:hypothetical protein